MSIKELRENRFYIVLEALLKGLQIKYKHEWNLFYSDGVVYQTFYSEEKGKQITHKSDVSLQAFLEKFNEIPDKEIKEIYASIKLLSLQDKLLKRGKET